MVRAPLPAPVKAGPTISATNVKRRAPFPGRALSFRVPLARRAALLLSHQKFGQRQVPEHVPQPTGLEPAPVAGALKSQSSNGSMMPLPQTVDVVAAVGSALGSEGTVPNELDCPLSLQ